MAMSEFLKIATSSGELAIFFDDFAETRTLGGKKMPIIDEGNTLSEVIVAGRAKENREEGLYRVNHLLYFKAEDWGSASPARGAHIEYDGEIYLVDSVDLQDGIYIMGLMRAEE